MSQGVRVWNDWRIQHPDTYIDLREANLFFRFGKKTTTGENVPLAGINLSGANLSRANLAKVDFTESDLSACYAVGANFQGSCLERSNLAGAYMTECDFALAKLNQIDFRAASLSHCSFFMAKLDRANLRVADFSHSSIIDSSFVDSILTGINLENANLRTSDLTRVDLSGANLTGVSLVGTNLNGANLDRCRVFGTSVWDTDLSNTCQTNLIITPDGEPELTADNLKVAQFIYLILNNQEVRGVIDAITSKVVLVLGRFSEARKPILDGIRTRLRELDYIPVMFDFSRPSTKTFIGTVKTLAGMTRFVIADLTDARIVIQELYMILREFPSVPVQPLLIKGQQPSEVILDYTEFDTFLEIFIYDDQSMLLTKLETAVLDPVEKKLNEITERRSRLKKKLFDTAVISDKSKKVSGGAD
ncbi:MAG: pentapeptide repeat-containing protein [Verrucomicrobiota bacterium]